MTGVFEAFLAGIYAEIKMVTRLSVRRRNGGNGYR